MTAPRLVSTGRGWAVVALLGAFTTGACVGVVHPLSRLAIAAVVITGAGACLGLTSLRLVRPAAVVLLGLLAAWGGLARGSAALPQPQGATGGPVRVIGSVAALTTGTGRWRVVVAPDTVVDPSGERRGGAGVLATVALDPQVLPGDRVQVDASALRSPPSRAGPGGSDALRRQGVDLVAASPTVARIDGGGFQPAVAVDGVRRRLVAAVDAVLGEPAASLVLAIALGVRRPLPTDVHGALQDAGLIHVVAVSGLKVTIVAGLAARAAALVAAPRRLRTAGVVSAVGGYVVLAGAGPAAVRSGLMATAALLLHGSGRRADALPVLAATAAVMVALDPLLAGDAGFQLSFVGTLGILVLARPVARRLRGPRLLVEPFAVTLAAQLATAPVMATTFGTLALAGPVTNALVLPLLAPLILLGIGGSAASALVLGLGWLPLQVAGALSAVVVRVARVAAAVPFAAVHPGSWPRAWTAAELAGLAALGVAAAGARRLAPLPPRPPSGPGPPASTQPAVPMESARGRWSTRRWHLSCVAVAALVTAAVAVAAARPDGRLHVTVLDVGVGTAALIRTPDGGWALVDGGPAPNRLLPALGAGLPPLTGHLDLVVLTGGAREDVAGLAALAGRYAVSRVIVPDGALTAAAVTAVESLHRTGARVDVIAPGAGWRWGGAGWRCLPAPGADPTTDAPPVTACALQVHADGATALVCGQLSVAAQEELAASAGPGLRSDLMVTAPGGMMAPALLVTAAPRQVAEPTARGARSLPTTGVPDGPHIRRTGDDGSLDFVSDGATMRPA